LRKRQTSRVSTPTWDDFPPVASLHPTAQEILHAAYDILREEGLSNLSFQRIAEVSGHHRGQITYFFGSKLNLIALLADMMSHEAVASHRSHLQQLPAGRERIHEVMNVSSEIVKNLPGIAVLLDVFGQAMREERLRERMADLYVDYRDITQRMLDDDPTPDVVERLERMAVLTVAIEDGLSIQYALDPIRFDAEPYVREWERVLRQALVDGAASDD